VRVGAVRLGAEVGGEPMLAVAVAEVVQRA
jgi:hypothetical protein